MTAARILNSWREIESHPVPSAAAPLSRGTVLRLVAFGFLKFRARGTESEVRVAADDLDAAYRAREEARSLARDRFGCRRRGGLSDRLAQIAYSERHPTSRPARAARDDKRRAQMQIDLLVERADDDEDEA